MFPKSELGRIEETALPDELEQARFRLEVLPHIDAAYNLARWLVGSDADAQDVAQEALLRAFRAFHQRRDPHARAWLLTIVRNCAFTWLRSKRKHATRVEFDETAHINVGDSQSTDPSVVVEMRLDSAIVRDAIAALPAEYREVIVLREMEQLDYKQIAIVTGVPIGTVMSRLARARARLRQALRSNEEAG